MEIKILGLGWFGLPLAESLIKKGHIVSGTVTSEVKAKNVRSDTLAVEVLKFPEVPSSIKSDILVLNIPPFKEELDWFKEWHIPETTWVIFISSTSVLTKKDETLTAQEEWIKKTFSKSTILRFGGLFGAGRHPGKSLSGKTNLSGKLWPVNLLHLDDAIGFTEMIIDHKIQYGTFDVFSGDHPTREEFYTSFCKNQNLPLPEFNPNDLSVKSPLDNSQAAKLYQFRDLRH